MPFQIGCYTCPKCSPRPTIVRCPERLCVERSTITCAADEDLLFTDDVGCRNCGFCRRKNALCGPPVACPPKIVVCMPDEDLISVDGNGATLVFLFAASCTVNHFFIRMSRMCALQEKEPNVRHTASLFVAISKLRRRRRRVADRPVWLHNVSGAFFFLLLLDMHLLSY
jgi:hypothetical protein